MAQNSKPQCLILDLETLPPQDSGAQQVVKIGALRPDTGESLEVSTGNGIGAALERLQDLSAGASFVLGHNVLAHDLPTLRAQAPDLALLRLAVIDTLHLSPLAFPQNPYHRLIKDYKLISASVNSPLADCRSTLTLFDDQRAAFASLMQSRPDELLCYQSLVAPVPGAGMGNLLLSLTRQAPLPTDEMGRRLSGLLAETDPELSRTSKVCQVRLESLITADLQQPELRWPLAYVLAWLRVSGGNSLLAPWVHHQFPAVSRLIGELRDRPCEQPSCSYCRTTHDPRQQLKRYFGYDAFRSEQPGRSLQHDIVLSAMRGESVLAVLATGGGKSLCYQLPALNRYHRNGSLTVIISPLQSLMKDQVDGLHARNVLCVAALNGLLTMPERAEVLEKIRLGDVGLLLVSPEQFRNRGFRRVIGNRQIGGWVFDEAHCLSKWGNDFRPDYLYAARFIREFTADATLAPIGCFTATAKQDVLDDIREHFLDELGVHFASFIGTPERPNLRFEVMPVNASEKFPRTLALLNNELGDRDGGAVVFVASRRNAEDLSSFLVQQNWSSRHFHAGLQPHEKKDIQDSFIGGALRVIVATNAFGMGVDKPDVRLVIHADIPGSLENYLQEAGRAGRDQDDARCVLLYDPLDIETQFGLSERSRLSFKDIQQILRKLRFEASRRKGGQLVITAGEILQDAGVQCSFEYSDRDAETKVVTAIAWLERGQFLRREENHTRVFPARLSLNQEAAEQRLDSAGLSQRRREEFRAIVRFLFSATADQRVDTDQLMQLTGQTQEEISSALKQLEALGLLENDSQLTMYLRYGIEGAASERLKHSLSLEQELFKSLRELAPDADQGGWQDLNLSLLTMQLRERCEQADLLPLHVSRLLHSLARDRDGDSQQPSSFELKQINRDHLKLHIRGGHSWSQIEELGDKRRRVAAVLLPFLVSKVPSGMRGKDLLVQSSFGELQQTLADDLELCSLIKLEQRQKAVEHVLLYLHNQAVLTLNHGMTVMRRAMTIDINPDKLGQRYVKDDFQRLDEHYRERRIQVHVMREYAEIALKEMADALRLVMHYFTRSKDEFLREHFAGKEEIIQLATSEASWKAIIDTLNPTQQSIVSDHLDPNLLVLAGPGSGKTRVVVHRIAYLLRVRRVPASAIIALTFNRHAANEIRRRLFALVGNDAIGVTVLTYHAMAMRLTGTRFERRETPDEGELNAILDRAAELLEGQTLVDGEDDVRERLLQGYRYILVDEYQDIDDRQYRLVSALATRHDDQLGSLCILAVGDDDQNIYQWRGGSNRHIERFRDQYSAKVSYLVENYRSSKVIIDAANRLIEHNGSRLKREFPIRIDQQRAAEPEGGVWERIDSQRRGSVLRLQLPVSDRPFGNLQAQAAVSELDRLRSLEGRMDWQGCALLARTHHYLWPLQAWCEHNGVAYVLAADRHNALPLTRQRAFIALLDQLRSIAEPSLTAASFARMAQPRNDDLEWRSFFDAAFEQLACEYGDCLLAPATVVDWLYDYAREVRQETKPGLFLGTVHSAKGLEFRHVVLLDGGWEASHAQRDEARRLYYVGMTRAEQTLSLCQFETGNTFVASLSDRGQIRHYQGRHDPALDLHYQSLTLADVDIGYAGRHAPDAALHRVIAGLEPGDTLQLQADADRYLILDQHGNQIGRCAKSFRLSLEIVRCEVAGIITRYKDETDPAYRAALKCQQWEVIVPRLCGRGQR